jgi:thioredoxin 1
MRQELDAMKGPVVLEFGASWCPHCQAIQAQMAGLLGRHSEVRHVQVEDGPGKPLGRSFRVKLWPTLVFMRDGRVLRVAVRPPANEIDEGFAELLAPAAG